MRVREIDIQKVAENMQKVAKSGLIFLHIFTCYQRASASFLSEHDLGKVRIL
jgi:hypothetical protein